MITLMVVGPYKLHVYWEITVKDISALKYKSGNSTLDSRYVLRVYDISGIIFDGNNAHYLFDIEVDKDAENWYIDLLVHTGNSYCVELGIKAGNKGFLPLARSNSVVTPKVNPSNFSKPRWMKVEIEHGKTSLQPEEYPKPYIDTYQSVCNDNSSPAICGDKNTRLTNYRPEPEQTGMIMDIAESWHQIEDKFNAPKLDPNGNEESERFLGYRC